MCVTYFVLGISYPCAGEGWTTFLVLSFTCPWKHRRLKCRVSRLSSCAWKQPDKAINVELANATLSARRSVFFSSICGWWDKKTLPKPCTSDFKREGFKLLLGYSFCFFHLIQTVLIIFIFLLHHGSAVSNINTCTQARTPDSSQVFCQQGQWKVICKHNSLNPALPHTPKFCQDLLKPPIYALSRNNLVFPNRPMSNIYTGRLFNSLYPTDVGERKEFL